MSNKRPKVEVGQVWNAYSKNLSPARKIEITSVNLLDRIEYRMVGSRARGRMLLESLYKDYRLAGTPALPIPKRRTKRASKKALPTRIVVLLDRSGSMDTIRSDMEGAFNTFIWDQLKVPGECLVSLHQFDNAYDTVYVDNPITNVPPLSLAPRGSTALWDAMGRMLNGVLATTGEYRTLIVVITDGEENASHIYRPETVRRLVKQAQGRGFEFVFFGANQNAVLAAERIGIYGNTVTFNANTKGVAALNTITTQATTAYRYGGSGQSLGITQTSYDSLLGDNSK